MNRSILAFCLLFLCFSCVIIDIDDSNSSTETVNSFLIEPDGLIISEFIEDGRNKISIFRPYVFFFDTNGSVTATKDRESIQGSFYVFRDDGRVELRMDFPLDSELFELTDDWYFISQRGNLIRFDDSGDIIEFQQQ